MVLARPRSYMNELGGPVKALATFYKVAPDHVVAIHDELDIPFVTTFHTLAKVKAEGGDLESEWRHRAEHEIIGCADAICVNCTEEEQQFRRLYGDPKGRLEIVSPGVEHAFFAPGERRGARQALELPLDAPVFLFVGRIQPLKGPDVAVRALAEFGRSDALLLIVGGASGSEGGGEVQRLHTLIDELGVRDQVRFVPPQPHHILSTYYRAADVVVVPSRSESFGLVALGPIVLAFITGIWIYTLSLRDEPSPAWLIWSHSATSMVALVLVSAKSVELGWRRVLLPQGKWGAPADHYCIDYSGWPLYAHESLSAEMAYKVVDAIHARVDPIKWDEDNAWSKFLGIGSLVAYFVGPPLFGKFVTESSADYQGLFLIPCVSAIAAAVLLALFFHPPKTEAQGGPASLPH